VTTLISVPTAPEVRVCDEIREIPAEWWDQFLDPADLQASHRFVAACQASGVERATFRHVVVRRGDRTEGIASLSAMRVSLDLLAPTGLRHLARAVRYHWPEFLRVPVLFCGLPVSFGQSCLRVRPGMPPEAVASILAGVMEQTAPEVGAGVLCFKEFSPGETAPLACLNRHGYFEAASLPGCSLALPWESFGEYLGAMRSNYRRQALATLAARDRDGFLIGLAPDPAAACRRLFPLYEQVMDRAPYQLERLNFAFFEELAGRLPHELRVLEARRSDRVVGGAILLRAGDTTTFLLAGLDYREQGRGQVYPNLVLEVVADAIRSGSTRVELGQTSYDLKGRIGGTTSPRTLLLRHCAGTAHRLFRRAAPVLFPLTPIRERRVFRQPLES